MKLQSITIFLSASAACAPITSPSNDITALTSAPVSSRMVLIPADTKPMKVQGRTFYPNYKVTYGQTGGLLGGIVGSIVGPNGLIPAILDAAGNLVSSVGTALVGGGKTEVQYSNRPNTYPSTYPSTYPGNYYGGYSNDGYNNSGYNNGGYSNVYQRY